ncbi:MAG TPA: glycosyltransferase family 2 protein [Solirubrobacteraceae bacterium]|nr:glycosyltransferase family 2 protein [Solirubrobacteraceae bacterium]
MADVSILMPVYNEHPTIADAVDQVLTAKLPVADVELVIVDDHSTDGTREWLRDQHWPEQVRLVLHDRNRGKGAAIATALEHARGTYATILDADLEYDAANIGPLLGPLLRGDADAVYGVRGFDAHSAYSFWYVVGNKLVTTAANALYNTWLSDIMTCQKVLPTDLFRALNLRESGFAFEAEVTARLMRAGVRIYEVPITYQARSREEGKKLTARDGLRVLRTLVRCRFDRCTLIDPSRHIPRPPGASA